MIAGHFGFAAIVKSREPEVPLWALMLATVWLDIVFIPTFLTGIESMENVPGTEGGYGNAIIHADFTHSLLGALVLSAMFGAVAWIPWGRRCALVLGAVVFSHWLLDLLVHRGDMPLLPGNLGHWPTLGLGLWRWPATAVTAELGLVVVGSLLYWRRALACARTPANRRWANAAGSLILVAGCVVLGLDVIS